MNASSPRVSVILPTYNRARLLPRAVASVLGQSFRDFELLIVDDASTDDTAEVVRRIGDPRVRYLPSGSNLGDAGARNYGARHARGEWLAFQDSDDEWLPEKLRRQVECSRSLPARYAAVASTTLRFTGGPVERIAWARHGDAGAGGGEVDRTRFIADFTAYLQSLLVRRSVFESLGGFDTGLRARSDFEFCLRLIVSGHSVHALDEPLALSYEVPGSISQRLDFRKCDIRNILARHRELIAREPRVYGHYLYELAKVEMLTGDKRAGVRSVIAALRLRPRHVFSWVLLATVAFPPHHLQRLILWRQGLAR